ncbi:hypothetical protein [Tenacibaculum finnmarkense]|uniref:hypothetical protein n=1 Tax=Tenacibaculum finnmarkense TaxID=2781243 RepID=UPI000C6378FE|nr:hypothetical protein [Tenacibaculum finnmarkense]MCD8435929.1 hypothetical protein [Tenacibaculum dicentrarchi]MCG8750524.1 hypothetical protein [Tenacibaculum finnmarkense]MCG8755527.1 hypothetical protein [Tenacibaculum finnmarkense]MCG8784100.1 hypothetical protein [Tenacibaculum finnmarkense]MCG8804025.1 hypothetical protein [Tenacibaculum finnmarkense]
MARVYFDKQIFSNLFKGEKEEYQTLLEKIKDKKLLICYSHALLLDLKNDKTDYKYKELEFIETLVNDNYLSYHALDKKTSPYLAKPLEAFKDLENEDDNINFDEIFNFNDDTLTESEKKIYKTLKSVFYDTNFDLDINELQTDNFPVLDKLFPKTNKSMNLIDIVEYGMNLLKTLNEEKKVYKDLRKINDENLNNGKFILEYDNIDFNENFKNSLFKKTFLDYISESLNPNGKKKITKYDFFTYAYINLDILGISKEPSKSVRFRNLMNDGFHSYYGAYCDIVVSEDKGFIKKSKALYKLLNIDTKVVNTEEFLKILDNDFKIDKTIESFLNRIPEFVNDENLKNCYSNIKTKKITNIYSLNENLFGYFNQINVDEKGEKIHLYFRKNRQNYSIFNIYREFELVVNNCFYLFGIDNFKQEEYLFHIENKQLKNGDWKGRFWNFGTYNITVDINKNYYNEIYLLLEININN